MIVLPCMPVHQLEEFCACIGLWSWKQHTHGELLVIGELNRDRLEHQRPRFRMGEGDGELAFLSHLMEGPPVAKLSTDLLKVFNHGREPGVVEMVSARHTKESEQRAGLLFPVDHQATKTRMGKVMPDDIALSRRIGSPIIQDRLSSIPGQDIPARIANMSRRWFERSKHLLKRWLDGLKQGRRIWRKRLPSELKKMPSFIPVQLEATREIFCDLPRDVNSPTLFQPGVPGDTDIDEFGHIFAPEARRPTSPPRR